MKISELVRIVKLAGTAVGQMKKILNAEKEKGPEAKITIEHGMLREWYQALLGISMMLGGMEIEEIKTEK